MIVQAPKTLGEFKAVRETILELMGNPYCDHIMFCHLIDKLKVTDVKIEELTHATEQKPGNH